MSPNRTIGFAFLVLAVAACGPRGDVFAPDLDPTALSTALAERARAEAPSPEVLTDLAWLALLHGGRADEAAAWFERAEGRRPLAWSERFGLATAQELRGRPDEAARSWAGLLATAPDEARRLAAHRLVAAATEIGPSPALEELVATSLTARPLPDPALQADVLAALRRTRGAAPEGTVRRVTFLGAVGRPNTAFVTLAPGAARPTGRQRPLVADAEGWLRLPDEGLAVAEASVTLAGTVRMTLESSLSVRVLVDDVSVLTRDAVRGFPPERVAVTLRVPAGEHRLRLEAAVDATAEGIRVRILPTSDEAPVTTLEVLAEEPPPAEGPAVLAAWVRAWRLLEEGDALAAGDALRRARRLLPRAGGLAWLTALALRRDPTLPAGVALEREVVALREAIALDPSLVRARVQLVERFVADGRSAEALAELAAAGAEAGESPLFDRLAIDLFVDRGWETEAHAALARALARRPDDCELLRRRLDLEWETVRVRPWSVDPTSATTCPDLRRAEARYLVQVGRPIEAAERYRTLAASPDGTASDRRALADSLVLAGRYDEARAALVTLAEESPDDLDIRLTLAELHALADDTRAAAELRAVLERHANGSGELRRRLVVLQEQPFWTPFAVEGTALVAAHREEAETLGDEADAVFLLDQQVSRFFGDGAVMQYVHAIILVRTPRGAEGFGELGLREGAEVLVARTLKADGGIEEPDEMVEKSTLSMPSLAPGDIIDFAYVVTEPPRSFAAPAILSDTFYFRSYAAPVRRAEWTVLVPADAALAVEVRGDMDEPARRDAEPLVALTWSREGATQRHAEPETPDARAALPSVRVGTVAWPAIAASVADELLPLFRLGRTGRSVARQLAREHATPRERARAAFVTVQRELEDETEPFLETPAEHTFARGRGERLVALGGLLAALDVPFEVVLLKPVHRIMDDGPVPDTLAYSYPVLRLPLEGGDVWLDPSLGFAPFDYVPPILQDRPGLSLGAEEPGAARVAPRYPLERERRDVRLDLEVLPGGEALVGEGHEEIAGIQGIVLRQALLAATDDERRAVATALLQLSVPDAIVEALDVDHLEDGERPLVLTYRLRAPLPRAGDGDPVRPLFLGLLPEGLGGTYAALGQRELPLFLNRHIDQRLSLTVTLPASAELLRVPTGRALHTAYADHVTRIWSTRDSEGRDVLNVRKELTLPLRIVPPEEYDQLAWACRALDRADTLRVDLRWLR